MGIFEWIKSQTGVWGPAVLEIYFHNAGWINLLVIVYGLILLLSWQNLSRVVDELAEQILEQAKSKHAVETKSKKPKTIHLDDFDLSWEQAIASSKFPFVAKQAGLAIHRSNPDNIRALITERDLIQRCSRRLNEIGLRLEQSR